MRAPAISAGERRRSPGVVGTPREGIVIAGAGVFAAPCRLDGHAAR
jgi:hypothetical protein